MEQHLFQDKRACCFTGHRPDALPDGGDERSGGMFLLRRKLISAVECAVRAGVTDFYAGGAQGFDLLAADAVLAIGAHTPNVRLHLALPGEDCHRRYPVPDRKRFEQHLLFAESVWYPADPVTGVHAFHARDRYMVDHADCVIAYLTKGSGGTFYTVKYALSRGLPVYHLA